MQNLVWCGSTKTVQKKDQTEEKESLALNMPKIYSRSSRVIYTFLNKITKFQDVTYVIYKIVINKLQTT